MLNQPQPQPQAPLAAPSREDVAPFSTDSVEKGATSSGGEAVQALLVRGPELSLWRAATDNDGFKLLPDLRERIKVGGTALTAWLQAGLDHRPADELVRHRSTVTDTPEGREYRHTIEVPDALADLPRIGVSFEVPARFSQIRWYGRGPHENYPDRNRSAMLGVWQQAPDSMPYLVPQEFGLRTDCRWIELIDPDTQQVLRIDVLQPGALHFSATRHTAAQLYAASTATELQSSPNLVVHLDVAHRGLGTASCGPDVLPQYRIPSGTHHLAYRLSRGT